MIEFAERAVAWLMNQVRVNQIRRGTRDGKAVFVKRRRPGAAIVLAFANQFLAWAHGGAHMFVRADEWLDWEVYCHQLLYPDQPSVEVGPGAQLTLPAVPGTSLREMLRRNEINSAAFGWAARELRRVHQLPCRYFQSTWSHGDLHLDNMICDLNTQRAALIDFDTRHDLQLASMRRHSDDLKLVLLELLTLPDDQWRLPATTLITEYGERSVLQELNQQLFVPRAFARVLWYTRTNGALLRHMEPRLKSLREIVDRVA